MMERGEAAMDWAVFRSREELESFMCVNSFHGVVSVDLLKCVFESVLLMCIAVCITNAITVM